MAIYDEHTAGGLQTNVGALLGGHQWVRSSILRALAVEGGECTESELREHISPEANVAGNLETLDEHCMIHYEAAEYESAIVEMADPDDDPSVRFGQVGRDIAPQLFEQDLGEVQDSRADDLGLFDKLYRFDRLLPLYEKVRQRGFTPADWLPAVYEFRSDEQGNRDSYYDELIRVDGNRTEARAHYHEELDRADTVYILGRKSYGFYEKESYNRRKEEGDIEVRVIYDENACEHYLRDDISWVNNIEKDMKHANEAADIEYRKFEGYFPYSLAVTEDCAMFFWDVVVKPEIAKMDTYLVKTESDAVRETMTDLFETKWTDSVRGGIGEDESGMKRFDAVEELETVDIASPPE